jgi:transcriptional regulator with XRE-family HTH domain
LAQKRAEILMLFGRRLRDLRRELDLSQAVLAERADITSEHVSRIERALVGPSLEVIDRLAKALGVEVRALFEFGAPRTTADSTFVQLADIVRRGSPDDRRLLLKLADTVVQYRSGRR